MKLTVDRKALADALKIVTRAVPRATGFPVLAGVHVDATPAGMRLTCTDLDLTASTRIDATSDEPGTAIIPARTLLQVVAKLDGETATIVGGGDGGVTVAGRRTSAEIPTMSVGEWPLLPDVEGSTIVLAPEQIADLRRAMPFSSVDYNRAGLTGIVFDNGEIRATNSYNGIVIAWPTLAVEHPANVPAAAIASVLATVADDEHLELVLDKNHVSFEHGDTYWTIRQLADPGPQMKHLFRDRSDHHVDIEVAAWSEAVATVAILDRNEPVRIDIDKGVATFTSRVTDVGVITTTAEVEGDLPFQVAVNAKWFTEVITAPGDERVTLEIADALKPIQVESGGARTLVMPVRVS